MQKDLTFKDYIDQYGFGLVELSQNGKGTFKKAWGTKPIINSDLILPDKNYGIVLGYSKMCSIDVDNVDYFLEFCKYVGVKIPWDAPTYFGNPDRAKMLFRMPASSKKLSKRQLSITVDDKPLVIFEILGSNDGKQVLDVLPPSIHKGTKKPYTWINYPPLTLIEWPYLPNDWLCIWEEWDQAMDDKAVAGGDVSRTKWAKTRNGDSQGFDNVIQAFNNAHSIEAVLQSYGYKKQGANKYLSPNSQSGDAGVTVFIESGIAYSHHASDGELAGKAVDCFELFAQYEHGGDKKLAYLAALKGMRRTKVSRLLKGEKE